MTEKKVTKYLGREKDIQEAVLGQLASFDNVNHYGPKTVNTKTFMSLETAKLMKKNRNASEAVGFKMKDVQTWINTNKNKYFDSVLNDKHYQINLLMSEGWRGGDLFTGNNWNLPRRSVRYNEDIDDDGDQVYAIQILTIEG